MTVKIMITKPKTNKDEVTMWFPLILSLVSMLSY